MGAAPEFNLEFYKNKRVFITGDSGFKGSWLSLMLWQSGAHVTGYSLPPYTGEDIFVKARLAEKIHHFDGELADTAHLSSCFQAAEPEIVFHLAAQPLVRVSYLEPSRTFATNIQGSVNLLECVRESKSVKALVFVTSDKCYKNKEWIWGYRENDELGGHDPYSASKAAAEIVFESYRLSFFGTETSPGAASVRAGNVIGGGDWSIDRIVPDSIRSLQAKEPVRLRNPYATRPWQHVLEPVVGYMQLASLLHGEPRKYSGAWNFGPSDASHKTVRQLAEGIVGAWGEGKIVMEQSAFAPHEAGFLHLNCDKARNMLGWSPVWDFDDTVEQTVRWYKAGDKEGEALDQIRKYRVDRESKRAIP